MKRMLFNATQAEELRVAIVDGQKLIDLDIESASKEQRKNNIYKAVITRIEPSLEACFVDYGAERHGFLPFKEVSSRFYLPGVGHRASIKEALREGQELIVQVEKDERGNKGASLTTLMSLAGRYLVLMPTNARGGGVSRRAEGEDRTELRGIMDQLLVPEGMSLIIRTAAVGRGLEELQWDLNYLLHLWQAIDSVSAECKAPLLIYQEGSLVIRAIRDYFQLEIGEILIDTPDIFEQAQAFMGQVMPDNLHKVKFYRDDVPLFSRFQIEHQIETAFSRQVALPSGGAVVIDHTEALVAIDVNSGRATRGSDIEETALKTNLEAADEIARQLRLRDLGGLIVIDFIDMDNTRNQREVEARVHDGLRYDRARVQVSKISRFGLMELSRQRLRPALAETSYIPCPRCTGTGHIRSTESAALHILRILEEEAMKENTAAVHAQVPVDVATFLLNEKRADIQKVELRHHINVLLVPNIHLETPQHLMTRLRHEELNQDDIRDPSYRMIQIPKQEEPQVSAHAQDPKKQQEAAIKNLKHITPPPEPQPRATTTEPPKKGLLAWISAWFAGKETPAPVAEVKPARLEKAGNDQQRQASPRNAEGRSRDRSRNNERGERSERGERNDRSERSERNDRSERGERNERSERNDRSERGERGERNERNERGERNDRNDRSERNDRHTDRTDKAKNTNANPPRDNATEGEGRKPRRDRKVNPTPDNTVPEMSKAVTGESSNVTPSAQIASTAQIAPLSKAVVVEPVVSVVSAASLTSVAAIAEHESVPEVSTAHEALVVKPVNLGDGSESTSGVAQLSGTTEHARPNENGDAEAATDMVSEVVERDNEERGSRRRGMRRNRRRNTTNNGDRAQPLVINLENDTEGHGMHGQDHHHVLTNEEPIVIHLAGVVTPPPEDDLPSAHQEPLVVELIRPVAGPAAQPLVSSQPAHDVQPAHNVQPAHHVQSAQTMAVFDQISVEPQAAQTTASSPEIAEMPQERDLSPMFSTLSAAEENNAQLTNAAHVDAEVNPVAEHTAFAPVGDIQHSDQQIDHPVAETVGKHVAEDKLEQTHVANVSHVPHVSSYAVVAPLSASAPKTCDDLVANATLESVINDTTPAEVNPEFPVHIAPGTAAHSAHAAHSMVDGNDHGSTPTAPAIPMSTDISSSGLTLVQTDQSAVAAMDAITEEPAQPLGRPRRTTTAETMAAPLVLVETQADQPKTTD